MDDVLSILLAETPSTDLERPSYTVVCWLYCSLYDVLWSTLAYVIATFGIIATLLALRRKNDAGYTLLGFGILALPLGLPAVYEGYRRAL